MMKNEYELLLRDSISDRRKKMPGAPSHQPLRVNLCGKKLPEADWKGDSTR
jgi:hypothetical protein